MSRIKKNTKNILGYLFSAWIILFITFLGFGFLFGPDVAHYLPDWYQNILLLGFAAIILIAFVQSCLRKVKDQKAKNQDVSEVERIKSKYLEMDMCKNPDLDFDEELPDWAKDIGKRYKARSTPK